jgi:S-adenosylmethionine:tRNA ribosyltransferase-isomerase
MEKLRLSSLEFGLPEELIALEPANPRDACRLLVLERASGRLHHATFRDIEHFLRPTDVLVVNASMVTPCRFWASAKTGKTFEILVLEEAGPPFLVRALLNPARKVKLGEPLKLDSNVGFTPKASLGGGMFEGIFEGALGPLYWRSVAQGFGVVPLPPYIARRLEKERLSKTEVWLKAYNPVYAQTPGSIAAPTAGLHFTPELLEALSKKGVEVCKIVLNVGLGTFKPLKQEWVEENRLEPEAFRVEGATLKALAQAKRQGRRVVAVGTTAVRTLESVAAFLFDEDLQERGASGYTDRFLRPGYRFQAVDALITNFHLPKSSLLALVGAFGGLERILDAYKEAISKRYRFYSFGDAMLVV